VAAGAMSERLKAAAKSPLSAKADDLLGLRDKATTAPLSQAHVDQLSVLQNHLWGEHRRSVLLVLQGLDAAGKDGTIRHVFTGVNPQGCRVASFKAPNDVEAAHDFLWRVHRVCPRAGEIGIFNRSHYEDVVTTRVLGLIDDKERQRRLRIVRDFEHLLVSQGTTVVKVFLHMSKDQQRRRLQARIDDPEKQWKFNPTDLDTRAQWDAYQAAYNHVIEATSTDEAPWYVVPADHKWVRNYAVSSLMVEILKAMKPTLPPAPPGVADIVIQ
jgi:PPK2 family polyphosphate:nucleotide phosphotransferase